MGETSRTIGFLVADLDGRGGRAARGRRRGRRPGRERPPPLRPLPRARRQALRARAGTIGGIDHLRRPPQGGAPGRARAAAPTFAPCPPPPALPRIDEERLNALLGQAVVEFGATVNAALVVIGDRLGLYRELAAARAADLRRARRAHRHRRALRARVAQRPGRERLGRLRRRRRALLDVARAGDDVRRAGQPRVRGRRVPARARLRRRARPHRRRVRHRLRLRLARARPRRLRRLPALLRARLPRQHRAVVDPRARRRAREAAAPAAASPTSAAARAPRRSSSPRATRTRASTAPTPTTARSPRRAAWPPRPASTTA